MVLQLPFLYHAWSQSGADAGPTRALGGLSEAVRNPETLRLGASLDALVYFTGHIFTTPWPAVGWRVILACAVIGTLWRARRDLALLAASVAPLACAVAGLSLWTGNYDAYWYLPLAPCAAITVGAALSLWRRDHIAIALLVLGLVVQPCAAGVRTQTIYRMPEYGALARGARAIKRQTPVVRGITTTFPLPPFANASFLYESLGGQLRDDAAFDAVIDDSGAVRFVPLVRYVLAERRGSADPSGDRAPSDPPAR